jgi:hypothetical protein
LEGLPGEALEEVEEFVTSLKKRKGKRETPGRNGRCWRKSNCPRSGSGREQT